MPRPFRHKKIFVAGNEVENVDYKDVNALKTHLTEANQIMAGHTTGTPSRYQRKLSTEVKRARYLALLPYTDRH